MSSSNPLLPEGSVQELDQEKMKTRIWIIGIIGVHICVIFVLLIQGCSSERPASGDTDVAGLSESGSEDAPSITDLPQKGSTQSQQSNDRFYGEDANLPGKTKPSGAAPGLKNPQGAASGQSGQENGAGGETSGEDSSGDAGGSQGRESSSGKTTYTIKSGDKFQSIASDFDVSIQEIIDANPGVNPRSLQVGQTITIPDAGSAETSGADQSSTDGTDAGSSGEYRTYKVKKGDSLWAIQQKTGVSVRKIRKLNDLSSNRIDPGQKLKLPK